MKRKSKAIWTGSGKEGKGSLTTQSEVLKSTPYTFNSRFGDENATNPEELVAAAHAGCFAMKLSIVLVDAGFSPDELAVECTVSLEDGYIKSSHLVLKAKVDGIDKEKFDACVKDAKENCPISKSLTANITIEAGLV